MVDHQMFDKEAMNRKKEAPESEPASPTHEIPTVENQVVGLQNSVGNQGVQRMLSGAGSARPSMFIQAKMVVGAADDAYEQEANRVAHEIVNNPVQREAAPEEELQMKRIQREAAPEEEELQMKRIQREAAPEEEELQMKRIQREAAPEEEELQMKRIQREAAPEEEELQMKRIQRNEAPEMEEEQLQAKRIQRATGDMSGSFEVGEDIESSIESKKGGGSPLPDAMRSQMESGFGQDFSGVSVHTGKESEDLNESVGARAFTTGSDIFFGKNEGPENKELLAHELTHVVQQGGSKPKDEAEA